MKRDDTKKNFTSLSGNDLQTVRLHYPSFPCIIAIVPVSRLLNLMRYSSVLNANIRFFCSENRNFLLKVKSRPFKDDQIEMMRTVARNNSLNCVQCASLMALYTFDDDKMKVLNIFAPNIVDPENYEAILDVIDSLFKKDDAKKILGIRY